jgi:hypothetical protein
LILFALWKAEFLSDSNHQHFCVGLIEDQCTTDRLAFKQSIIDSTRIELDKRWTVLFEVSKKLLPLPFPITQVGSFENIVKVIEESFLSVVAEPRRIFQLFFGQVEKKLTDYLLIQLTFVCHMK